MHNLRSIAVLATLAVLVVGKFVAAANIPESVPIPQFHLTARPWKPLNISRDAYLDAVEGICRFSIHHQDAKGAIIDPFLHREHQYSTPYFAFAVGTLIHAGRANDLLPNGIRAMDHATACFAKGNGGIPDAHGEFFLASLPGALELYEGHVSGEQLETWRQRLKISREKVIGKNLNNWRTYAMKGEWLRSKLKLVDHNATVTFIEDAWLNAEQRTRIGTDRWNLYQDHNTNPESHAVEGVGRGNLLALIESGYDGPSAAEMRAFIERGTTTSLLLQDPTGQCPPDGRTDDHVWNDILYQLCFEVMAEHAHRAGNDTLAGQYRHAAMLSFNSTHRWQRSDGEWAGSYFITKNHFDPAQRIGYQTASNYGNYNGAVMIHLAEAYLTRKSQIEEQPAPTEIGGYAFATDAKFASAVANAGGMQMFAALRGDTNKVYNRYWTSLGVNRFSRVNWDSRLGPSDGERDGPSGCGVTFAPTWFEDGTWVHLADVPQRYQGKFSVQFAHPLLVRCAIDYVPIKGGGPSFRHEFVVTPDGVLATLQCNSAKEFGVTWPLLDDDGSPLRTQIDDHTASTAYGQNDDDQNFISLTAAPVIPENPTMRVQSTYGWLRPVRAMAANGTNITFVYPRNANDPSADILRQSFHLTDDGFDSGIASVHGSLYVGRTSAGGEGQSIDIDRDGKPDATFDPPCRFILQLRDGKITAAESDRKTTLLISEQRIELQPYTPVKL